ncbi:MAG: hypothetical protein LBC20_15655 [Planctomycetaceae bacterium]|jgi:hypothetical protein|nr:hypothetical protein [Planctomycetaceae bacterium]
MSQQFEYSLDVQGNIEPFLSEFSLVAVPTMAEPDASAIHSAKQKLKKKRGRPRKALPINVLSPNFSRQTISCPTDWESNQFVAEKNPIISNPVANVPITANHHNDYTEKNLVVAKNLSQEDEPDLQDSEYNGKRLPFFDEELVTLDEFEKLSRPVEQNLSDLYDFKRIDKPTTTPPPAALPKQKKKIRRRQIDPSTCERDYSQDEIEFMNALNEYKRTSGRMFPTCSEILEVLKNLGYEKRNSEPEYDWNNEPQNSNTDCLQLKN